MSIKAIILDEKAMQRAVTRISYEIIEKNKGVGDLILVGIRTRGYPLAKRLANKIKEIEGKDVPVYSLDITFYRDDLSRISEEPTINDNLKNKKENIDGKVIVLVDDVIYTGRTVRAALDAIVDIGRPSRVELAILVDRGHREFPIRADYVGKNTPTSKTEKVKVSLKEIDGKDEINILENEIN